MQGLTNSGAEALPVVSLAAEETLCWRSCSSASSPSTGKCSAALPVKTPAHRGAALGSAPPRPAPQSPRDGELRGEFVNRAEVDSNGFVNSALTRLEVQPQSIPGATDSLHALLETAPGRTQKTDFNLEKQRRKPLTQLLKCLGADLDLLVPAYQVLYTRLVRLNLKSP